MNSSKTTRGSRFWETWAAAGAVGTIENGAAVALPRTGPGIPISPKTTATDAEASSGGRRRDRPSEERYSLLGVPSLSHIDGLPVPLPIPVHQHRGHQTILVWCEAQRLAGEMFGRHNYARQGYTVEVPSNPHARLRELGVERATIVTF